MNAVEQSQLERYLNAQVNRALGYLIAKILLENFHLDFQLDTHRLPTYYVVI